MENNKTKFEMKTLIKTLIIAAVALLFTLPLLWMLSASLKTTAHVMDFPIEWIPKQPQWENFVKIWTDDQAPFTRLYWNSLLVTVVALFGQLLFSSMAAYVFAKLEFKGKNVIFLLMLSSMMIPKEATIIPQFVFFKSIGLYNNLASLMLPNWFNVSTIFLLRQFYMGIPNDLMEAAKLDGAGHLKIWWSVYMPLTKTAMVSAGILAFISIWNEYLQPLILLTEKKLYTLPLGIRYWLVDDAKAYNLVMAAAASAIIPMLIVILICQKYVVQGIAMSGSKE